MAKKTNTPGPMPENTGGPIPGQAAGQMFDENLDDELSPLLRKMGENWKIIAAVVGGLLFVVAAYGVINHVQKSNYQDSVDALGKILIQPDASKRLADLDAYLADAPGSLKTEVQFAIASAALDSGEFDRAAKALEAAGEGVEDNLSVVAELARAQALAMADKPAEALAIVEKLKGSAPEIYSQIIDSRTAIYAEAAGDTAKALSVLEGMEVENETMKAYYEFKKARLKAQNG